MPHGELTSGKSRDESAEGKSISALNATTHGLTAKSPILPSESPLEYQAFQSAVFERYEPDSLEDIAILDEYTDISWRLRRVPVHEARLIILESSSGCKSNASKTRPSPSSSKDSTTSPSKPSPTSAS